MIQILIEENLETFGELYKQASFIPKMHYLIHIPQYLKRYNNLLIEIIVVCHMFIRIALGL